MQKTVVTMTDDLTGKEGSGIETVTFAIEGKTYEIDLNPLNRANFLRSVKKYMENGRPVRAKMRKGSKAVHAAEVSVVRQWAQENGHQVADRGRIPESVWEAYRASNA